MCYLSKYSDRRSGISYELKNGRWITLAAIGLAGLETMDAETLVNTPLASTPFVVSELIPQGEARRRPVSRG